MKNRYFIQLSYNGKNYVGWQIQPNGPSVQESLSKAISKILSEKISITGCGRTDAGVHARFFIAHFDSNKDFDCGKLIYSLNNFLPTDIAIQKIFPVDKEANARFDAISRTYEYCIVERKNPFLNDFAYRFTKKLAIEKMNLAAKRLLDYTDFTSFSKLHTDVKTNNCSVSFAQWEYRNDMLVFTIRANRFLRNMVRAIVGTLIDVGLEKITEKEFCKIIESKNRSNAGFSVPAQGLYLTDIEYPENYSLREFYK